jgi:hypothetical protein
MFAKKSPHLPAWLMLPAAFLLAGCFESPNGEACSGCGPGTDTIPLVIPATYNFLDTTLTASNVDYGGQTVRNLLINDIQAGARVPADTLFTATSFAASEILKYYVHVDADSLGIRVGVAGGKTRFHTKYAQIAAAKSLHDKVSTATVIGYGVPMDSLVRRWAAQIAANANSSTKRKTAEVYLDSNGADLSQLLSKGLSGAVAYYQATGVYLQGVTGKNNATWVAGKNYTEMQHNWDEAFGYFGAARDYITNYTDDELNAAGTSNKDTDNDGKIDFRSEFNFSMMGRYTGRRDRGLAGQDWNGDLFRAFIKGRALINAKRSTDSIAAQRAIIVKVWEDAYASNVISYIKATKNALADSNVTRTQVSGAWSELKAFAICLQFNPYKKITDAQLTQLHGYIGNGPVRTPSAARVAYIAQLDLALALMKTVYGFSDAQIAATSWL